MITRSSAVYELANAEARGDFMPPDVFIATISFLTKLEEIGQDDVRWILDTCLPEWRVKLGGSGSIAVSYAQLLKIISAAQKVLMVKNGFEHEGVKTEVRRGQIWARNGKEWRVHDLFLMNGATMALMKSGKDGEIVSLDVLRGVYRKVS